MEGNKGTEVTKGIMGTRYGRRPDVEKVAVMEGNRIWKVTG